MDPLTRVLFAALEPLLGAASSPAALRGLLSELGVEPPDPSVLAASGPLAGVLDPVAALAARVDEVRADLDGELELGEALALLASVPGLVTDVLAAARALGRAPELLADADVSDALRDPAVWQAALDALPGVLLAQGLQRELPGVYVILRAIGIVDVATSASAGRLDLAKLPDAVADPVAALATQLEWGAGPLNDAALSELLFSAADAARLPLTAGPADGAPTTPLSYELPLAASRLPGLGFVETGVVLEPLDGAEGVALGIYALGAAPSRMEIAGGGFVELTLPAADDTRLVLEPGAPPRLDGPDPGFEIAVGAEFPRPVTLFGIAGLGVSASGFRLAARYASDVIEVELDTSPGVTFGLTAGADGFLRTLLGDAASVTVDAGLIWRHGESLRFSAGNDLTLDLPLGLTLGPVEIERVTVAVELGDPIACALTADVGATLGPLAFGVKGIGVAAELVPVDGTPACLLVRFTAPTRIDVSITSEVVTGSGFLLIDPDAGRYAGGLAIDVFGFGISAIVIVDTELPGGHDGFALFGSLGLTFPTPIPLGLGFTLIGVGGVLALNRMLDVDALAEGMRTGASDAILFPEDIEHDADLILAGLDDWFPAADGSTVFGPALVIGWGSPTLVTAQLGVIITLPDLVIALLGSVEVLLPTQDDPVLTLRMDVIGAVDVAASTVIVAASLHDSNLLGVLELSGDMGFYSRLSDQPLFLLSIGGYHPRFQPPGGLPSWLLDLRRTTAAIDLGSNVEVVLTSYVAITSNSVQFGGRFSIVASVEVLLTTYTAEGWFSVDLLLVLRPFKLVARATAGVAVSAGDKELFGVDLRARLEGPQPWFATGRASFTFFGIDVDFGFDVGAQPGGEAREIHDVARDVIDALSLPEAWEAVDGDDAWGGGVVTADTLPEGLWARPDQLVQARQSVAPLNRTITAFGEFAPAADRIDVSAVTLGGAAVDVPGWLDDWFAPAQFDRLGNTDRLSAPSYELMTAGVRFGADAIDIGADPDADCTAVSQEPETSVFPDAATALSGHVSPALPAAAASVVRGVAGPRVTVAPTTYTVVRRADGLRAENVLADAGAGSSLRYTEAVGVVAGRPAAQRARLKVAPSHAAVAA